MVSSKLTGHAHPSEGQHCLDHPGLVVNGTMGIVQPFSGINHKIMLLTTVTFTSS